MDTKLKEIRKARGYKSARAFAESIGMQEKTYRNYEQGARGMNLEVACEICTALGCTLDELVGNKPFKAENNQPIGELATIMDSVTDEGRKQIMIYSRGVAASYPKNERVRDIA